MNTLRFPSSLSNVRAPFTRAQFSPLSRGNSASTKTSAAATRMPVRFAEASAFPLWSSAMLDRLQPIVTRYHD